MDWRSEVSEEAAKPWGGPPSDHDDPISILVPHLATAVAALEQLADVSEVVDKARRSGVLNVAVGHLNQLASFLSTTTTARCVPGLEARHPWGLCPRQPRSCEESPRL